MQIVGLECINLLVETGKAPLTNRRNGSVKGMAVRMTGTHCGERLRNCGATNHLEIMCHRKKKNPQAGVVTLIKTTEASHGFNGFLGLCEGHPLLETIPKDECTVEKCREEKKEGDKASEESSKSSNGEDDSFSFATLQAAEHPEMTMKDFLAAWDKRTPKPSVVTISSPSVRSDITSSTSPGALSSAVRKTKIACSVVNHFLLTCGI